MTRLEHFARMIYYQLKQFVPTFSDLLGIQLLKNKLVVTDVRQYTCVERFQKSSQRFDSTCIRTCVQETKTRISMREFFTLFSPPCNQLLVIVNKGPTVPFSRDKYDISFQWTQELLQGMESVNLNTKKSERSDYERSDVCALSAASVVMEHVIAFQIAASFMDKFGGDSMLELHANYKAYNQLLQQLPSDKLAAGGNDADQSEA